jgi:hypothetical protein
LIRLRLLKAKIRVQCIVSGAQSSSMNIAESPAQTSSARLN